MAATRITIVNNGSIRVEGDFELVDQDGEVLHRGEDRAPHPHADPGLAAPEPAVESQREAFDKFLTSIRFPSSR